MGIFFGENNGDPDSKNTENVLTKPGANPIHRPIQPHFIVSAHSMFRFSSMMYFVKRKYTTAKAACSTIHDTL